MNDRYKCKDNCPICGSPVEVFGSDCYPIDGINIECTAVPCEYMLMVSSTISSNVLLDTAKEAHAAFCKNFKNDGIGYYGQHAP